MILILYSPYVAYSYCELNCGGLHILITFISGPIIYSTVIVCEDRDPTFGVISVVLLGVKGIIMLRGTFLSWASYGVIEELLEGLSATGVIGKHWVNGVYYHVLA